MLLDHDFLNKWEGIVNDVDKQQVPISCVKKVIFRTADRKQKTINLKKLRDQGFDIDEIDGAVTRYIEENKAAIATMEFVLDVEAVADAVQPHTDKLLKGMS
jgi:hypothetical protein